jgi:uncharacterized protein YhaN
MRFVRLVVDAFRAIEHAEVHFGPGLNVLYGPNDLGKSTLAAAIRAALLVTPTSSEASQFSSWFADAAPCVALTFVDATERYWTIRKAFGDGSNRAAELLFSNDGTSFTLDCKGREVEERIRALLAWGIPAPGGKAGARGVPNTFLANALLAAQTDVDSILEASLATDPDATGKVRLSKALATLAQDPLFKKVLDAAQQEVDVYFTRAGQRSRAQTSKFTMVADAIKALQKELDDLQRLVADSTAIEEQVNGLRTRRDRAVMRAGESAAALSATRARLARTRTRQEASARLEAAKGALSEIDRHAERVGALALQIERLALQVKSREEDLTRAAGEMDAANAAVHDAQERLRVATSEDGARQRELLRAQLTGQAAVLVAERQAAENRRGAVVAALKATGEAKLAGEAAVTARGALGRLVARLEAARESRSTIDTELELARATLAYGRWRSALFASEEAAKAAEAAAKCTTDAKQKAAEAWSLEERASALETALAIRLQPLPTPELVTALIQIERQLELAEAALGGGVTVLVRPRKAVTVHARIDEKETVDQVDLAVEHTLEADRSVHLSVLDLIDIEVTAGAADQRREVDRLRARRKKEVAPVLKRAGLKSLSDVATALDAVALERRAVEELRKRAKDLQSDAAKLVQRAQQQAEQVARLSGSAEGIEARKLAIGDTAPGLLEKRLATLGSNWETQAETLYAKKSKERETAENEVRAAEQAAKLGEYQASEAERRASQALETREAALAVLRSSDLGQLLTLTEQELASFERLEAEIAAKLTSLMVAVTDEVDKAKRAVDASEEGRAAAKKALALVAAALDASKAEFNARTGEAIVLRAQLEGMDRVAADMAVEQRARELSALPVEKDVSEADLAAAEHLATDANRELEAAKEDLHKSEGALSKVGGIAVREEVERIQEALGAERAREREIETDADAWKLLRNTLREIENDEGAHLGRALAGPVSKKFAELTAGRYKDLRFDATLRAEAVGLGESAATGSDVLSGLSTGTRNQLATLIRLTIAAQLKSAIVLDDHLVHTDPVRLAWFREMLMKTALNTQVVVLTCRPEDYLTSEELLADCTERDLAGGTMRVINVARAVKRWAAVSSRRPPAMPAERGGTR